jgi:Mrp family chromosome partitioning ATPase
MQQVLADLCAADPRRIVIFDSSPLLLTSESRALANVAGQVVMLVRAESTSQRAVLDAIEILGENKSIGLVLNQCEPRKALGDYPYYGTEYGSEELSATSK